MLKIMLENDGIQAFMNNEVIGTLLPFYTTPGMGAVRLVVSEADFEKALRVVAEFEKDRLKKVASTLRIQQAGKPGRPAS